MKTKKSAALLPLPGPSEAEIRDYAYHLYVQEGRVDGHDFDHWIEAEACLKANIPLEHARTRLHRHRLAAAAPGIESAA